VNPQKVNYQSHIIGSIPKQATGILKPSGKALLLPALNLTPSPTPSPADGVFDRIRMSSQYETPTVYERPMHEKSPAFKHDKTTGYLLKKPHRNIQLAKISNSLESNYPPPIDDDNNLYKLSIKKLPFVPFVPGSNNNSPRSHFSIKKLPVLGGINNK
jgi:hypothetical protein